ncbi:MAG TPA: hypothetical protein VGN83_05580 [Falsiroseomonas sp.]|jgi:hypothetical protein|nr:hypothetical protein [Falsiroseomonas sp.]
MADLIRDYRLGDRASVESALDIRIGPLSSDGHGFARAPVTGWLAVPGPPPGVGYSLQGATTASPAPQIVARLALSLEAAPCIRLRDLVQVLIHDRAEENWTLTMRWHRWAAAGLRDDGISSLRITAATVRARGSVQLSFTDLADGCATGAWMEGS